METEQKHLRLFYGALIVPIKTNVALAKLDLRREYYVAARNSMIPAAVNFADQATEKHLRGMPDPGESLSDVTATIWNFFYHRWVDILACAVGLVPWCRDYDGNVIYRNEAIHMVIVGGEDEE